MTAIWESPLWELFDAADGWVSMETVIEHCPGGKEEALGLMEAFREEGFVLETDAQRGVRIAHRPDRLYPGWVTRGLGATFVGKRIVYAYAMGSAQVEAVSLAEGGAKDGTVVLCEYQSQGRGRRGRSWQSPPGSGLTFAVIIDDPGDPALVFRWTQLASVATAEAVEDLVRDRIWIKWPNDLYYNYKKLCGILAQWVRVKNGPKVVIGIGINVSDAPDGAEAICLKEIGVFEDPPGRLPLMQSVLRNLERWVLSLRNDGAGQLRDAWLRRSLLLGKHVKVEDKGRLSTGRVIDFLPDGRLQLMRDDGSVENFAAADVSVRPDKGY